MNKLYCVHCASNNILKEADLVYEGFSFCFDHATEYAKEKERIMSRYEKS